MAAALERALGSVPEGEGAVPEVPVLVLGPAGSGRTALLLRVALAGGAEGPRALLLAPEPLPRLAARGSERSALRRLELRYPRSRGSLCRELGALRAQPRPPALLLLDGLERYLGGGDGGGGTTPGAAAHLAALLLETGTPPRTGSPPPRHGNPPLHPETTPHGPRTPPPQSGIPPLCPRTPPLHPGTTPGPGTPPLHPGTTPGPQTPRSWPPSLHPGPPPPPSGTSPPQVLAALRLPPPSPHLLPVLLRYFPAVCRLLPGSPPRLRLHLRGPRIPPRRWRLRFTPQGWLRGDREGEQDPPETQQDGDEA